MPLKMKKERLNGQFVPKSLNEAERTIDVTWSTGARVRRNHPEYGFYYEEISLDPNHIRLDRLKNGAPVLNNHNDEKLFDQIGIVTRASVDDGVGTATLKFSEREDVEPIWKDVKAGIFRNISVGYKPYKAVEVEQENDCPVLRSIDTEFFEISLVPINAEPGAQVRNEEVTHELELVTRKEEGMPMPKKKDEKGKPKETGAGGPDPKKTEPKNTPPEPKDDSLETRAFPKDKASEILMGERLRIRAIEDRCQNHSMSAEFTRKLIDDGVNESQANQLILDELTKRSLDNMVNNQGRLPRIEAGDHDEIQVRRDAIKNAILHDYDPNLVKKDDLTERAYEYKNRSVIDIIRMDLERRGEKTARYSNNELVTRAFHSTSDFPLLMGNVADATLKQSYLNLVKEQTFRPLVRYQNAKNFKPMRKLQMGEIPSLERIPEGAEVSYGTISEHGEQWAIGSYGKAFGISREAIINDELDAILSSMAMWGAAAARLESNLAWGVFNTNPMVYKLNRNGINESTGKTWFHTDHGNLSDAAPLTLDSIEDAEYAMSIQKGHDEREGDELNLTSRYLIVPSRLKNTARKLIYGQFTPNAVEGVNIYQNQFTIISDVRLNPKERGDDAKYPWYLACDPNVLPVLWMAYLNGRKEPEIMYDTDFNTRSVKVRADLDVGVTHGDWKAVHKNPGSTRAEQLKATNLRVAEVVGE